MQPSIPSQRRFCFHCHTRITSEWTLFGFDDLGGLWLCADCAPTHDPGNPPRKTGEGRRTNGQDLNATTHRREGE
jgi:hypothetical protein